MCEACVSFWQVEDYAKGVEKNVPGRLSDFHSSFFGVPRESLDHHKLASTYYFLLEAVSREYLDVLLACL